MVQVVKTDFSQGLQQITVWEKRFLYRAGLSFKSTRTNGIDKPRRRLGVGWKWGPVVRNY